VHFEDIVMDTLDQITEKARSKRVESPRPKSGQVVHMDLFRISEVLVNLVENGIKSIGDQPANPWIELGWRKDGDEVVFFVQDDWIGIDVISRRRPSIFSTKPIRKARGPVQAWPRQENN